MPRINEINTDWFDGLSNIVHDAYGGRQLAQLLIELQQRHNELSGAADTYGTRLIHVDGSRTDAYTPNGSVARPYKAIQSAVDSITDEGPGRRYLISVGPGNYEENVVLKRHVSLAGKALWGPSQICRLHESSGVVLTVPYQDCLVEGIAVETAGGTAEEAAVKIADDGLGAGGQSFFVNVNLRSSTIARALWIEPNGASDPVAIIYAGIDGGPGGDAIYADGAGFIWFLGGGGGNPERGAKLVNGAFGMFGASAGINASETSATAWALEADGSVAVFLDATVAAYNGLLLRNGATVMAAQLTNLGGFTGTPVDAAAGTVFIIGQVALDSFGAAPWAGWVMNGASLLFPNAREAVGTGGIGGNPDQRPTGIPQGYRFFAVDMAPGGGPGQGSWLTWNGASWIDATGAAIL